MYKIINEDNSLVSEYPSNKLYSLLSKEEKEHIQIFKKEIEKLTEEEGLGKITVSLSYKSDIIEKEFEIKNRNGYTFRELEEIIDKIIDHMMEFCEMTKDYTNFMLLHISFQFKYKIFPF